MARHIGLGKETTYGTAVASTDFSEALSETLTDEREFERITTIRSNSTRIVNELSSAAGGEVVLQGNYQDVGYWIYGFLGDVDTTGAGPYTHTMPGSTGTTGREGIFYTVEAQRDSTTLTWRYFGSKVVSWSMAAALNQSPQHTFGVTSKGSSTGTATTASYPDFDVQLVTDMTITIDGATQDATALNFNAAWPVDTPYTIGSTTFAFEPKDSGVLEVTGDITVLVQDLVEYNKFDGTTDVDVAIAITDGTHSLTLNMNKCRLTAAPINMTGRDRLTGTYNFESFFDTTATENIQVVLVNDQATIP